MIQTSSLPRDVLLMLTVCQALQRLRANSCFFLFLFKFGVVDDWMCTCADGGLVLSPCERGPKKLQLITLAQSCHLT